MFCLVLFSLIIIQVIGSHEPRYNRPISNETKTEINKSLNEYFLNLNNLCITSWPNLQNCVQWFEDTENNYRYVLTNHIPTFYVPPYCPFGIGQGYCLRGKNHENCLPFFHKKCPDQSGREDTSGDVPVSTVLLYRFALNPDPTNHLSPKNLYDDNPFVWFYNYNNSKYYETGLSFNGVGDPSGAMIGVHITGTQIKGPCEAEGYNVDIAGLPFQCGGHVTPPVGWGPLWHFHKASLCLMENETDPINHSKLQGYADDGFPIYGLYDWNGEIPILDQCNGHFGAVDNNINSSVIYHYHARNFTWNGVDHFEPYWIGCLGPSKSKCDSTSYNKLMPKDQSWCGSGCNYDLCVQPGTNSNELQKYINSFGKSDWLSQYTINPY